MVIANQPIGPRGRQGVPRLRIRACLLNEPSATLSPVQSIPEDRSEQVEEQAFIESREEMEGILREEVLGYLGVSAGEQPYVVPLNYAYTDGKITFHCALTGKKLDAIRRNPQVCFTVARQVGDVNDHGDGVPCHIDSDSVICYGRARLIEDLTEREVVLNAFHRSFRPEVADLSPQRVQQCMGVEITIAEMTGRRERDRKRTYWRFRF
jgi:nitroimidazol reductase NimA-like FMN-containing flavoprotein (pyridoxamine 5'-phosphate oxidase superfamily)